MAEIEYWKYRCTSCREEPRHEVWHGGKVYKLGACNCKPPRKLEMVPLTKRQYYARLR